MFTLPKLPYEYDALSPYINADIQRLHYSAHHATYVRNLNVALEKNPEWQTKTIEEIITSLDKLPDDIKTAVRNSAGGHYNHSLFWQMMTPKKGVGQEPSGTLLGKIQNSFGDLNAFREKFGQAAVKIFGSGWEWLIWDDKEIKLMSTSNQDNPLTQGKTPLLCLDVWEHAYYLQYYNKRSDYVEAWWNIVNWDDVARRLDGAIKNS
ncbi:MAG: superoxide dismutase [Candidatus Omnitrophica bacterium]|nr:superoxide dismutase [Candidatus Omnitrophota bacterium]